jgi:hypothetical protein
MFQFNETVDSTPMSHVDIGLLEIADVSQFSQSIYCIPSNRTKGCKVSLSSDGGATPLAVDGLEINITLTELQRVTAVSLSGTSGGDGSPLVLDVFSGSFRDIAQNLINDALNFTIEEIADTINPEIVNVTVDYNTGVLQVLASEYLDLTPASYFDIDEMFFSDKSENAILEIQTMKVVGSAELGGTFSLNLGSQATSKISPSQISQVQEIRIASDAELGATRYVLR